MKKELPTAQNQNKIMIKYDTHILSPHPNLNEPPPTYSSLPLFTVTTQW